MLSLIRQLHFLIWTGDRYLCRGRGRRLFVLQGMAYWIVCRVATRATVLDSK